MFFTNISVKEIFFLNVHIVTVLVSCPQRFLVQVALCLTTK